MQLAVRMARNAVHAREGISRQCRLTPCTAAMGTRMRLGSPTASYYSPGRLLASPLRVQGPR